MKKILILLVSAGGGHLTSARAISEAVDQCYTGQVTTSIVDIAKEHWLRPVTRMDEAYRWLQKDGIWLWKLLWRTDDNAWLAEVVSWLVYPLFSRSIKRIYRAEQPDLICLDVMMPSGTEGFQMVWELRNNEEAPLKDVPIIMMTGIHDRTELRFYPESEDGTYKSGEYLPVQDFLDKPVAPAKLLEVVKAQLGE